MRRRPRSRGYRAMVSAGSSGTNGASWCQRSTPHQAAGGVSVALASTVSQTRLAVWGPNLPVAALRLVEPGNRIPARRTAEPALVGSWVVAVWRTEAGAAFAAGNFHQQAPMTCADVPVEQMSTSLALNHAMLGGGLFDLEGQPPRPHRRMSRASRGGRRSRRRANYRA